MSDEDSVVVNWAVDRAKRDPEFLAGLTPPTRDAVERLMRGESIVPPQAEMEELHAKLDELFLAAMTPEQREDLERMQRGEPIEGGILIDLDDPALWPETEKTPPSKK